MLPIFFGAWILVGGVTAREIQFEPSIKGWQKPFCLFFALVIGPVIQTMSLVQFGKFTRVIWIFTDEEE